MEIEPRQNRLVREQRKLAEGPKLNEKPIGLGTVRFIVQCSGDSSKVLANAKNLMMKVDETALSGWPSEAAWFDILPGWFVEQCSPELTPEEAEIELRRRKKISADAQSTEEEKWSVLNWIYWFRPENRSWYWWDAEVRDVNSIVVAVEVDDWPFPWGALSWLFRAAGAQSVSAES